jgi:hypothetical protein
MHDSPFYSGSATQRSAVYALAFWGAPALSHGLTQERPMKIKVQPLVFIVLPQTKAAQQRRTPKRGRNRHT